ncbi:MAG: FAD-binding oxidoreductase [Acidimicrobiales bacterium]
MERRAVADIRKVLDTAGWIDGEEAKRYTRDFRDDFGGPAVGVARPGNTQDVSAVVTICARDGLAVVAQGGNSSLSGGSVPHASKPTVILSLERMRNIETVNAHQFTMTVEAGVTIEAIQDAAAAVERLFAPDWGARGTATIGGAIATNAGGINVLRYGMTREHVLGVEVVLADGQIWNGLRALPKDNSGYDLKNVHRQ